MRRRFVPVVMLTLSVVLAAVQLIAAEPAAGTARPMSKEAAAAAANFDVDKIGEGVYALIRKDPPGLMCDGNSVLIVNDDDVVVVDAPEASKEMLTALRKITQKPVKYVINTHWHDDHITGNQVWRDAFPDVEFIAHAATRAYLPAQGEVNRATMISGAPGGAAMLRGLLEKNKSLTGADITPEERESYTSDVNLVDHYLGVVPGATIVLPTIVVDDHLTLYRGARAIEIRWLGRGHTSGDLVVYLPAERILVSGDLVSWPVPLVGADQSHPGDWSASLGKLREMKPAIIVPGHGTVMHDDAYVAMMQSLFASVRQQTEAAVAQGKTLDEVRKLVKLDEYRKSFAGDSPVRKVLFDMYVTGPAVGAAFADATAAR